MTETREQNTEKKSGDKKNSGKKDVVVEVRGVVADLTADNIEMLIDGAQLILDATDNFDARYLINDFAVSRGVPWIYGAAVASYGISMPVLPGRTACLRCVYPAPPSGAQPTCETAGVLNVIVSMIASLQVADALKILCGAEGWSPRLTTASATICSSVIPRFLTVSRAALCFFASLPE